MSSNTAIRLFALVLVVTLGLTVLPSVALADTTDADGSDGKTVCSAVTESLTETSYETDPASGSDGVDAPAREMLRMGGPAGTGSVTAKSSGNGETVDSYVDDDGLSGPPYSAKEWVEADGVPSGPAEDASTTQRVSVTDEWIDSAMKSDAAPANPYGIQLPANDVSSQSQSAGDSTGGADHGESIPSLPVAFFLAGAGVAAAMLTASRGRWRDRTVGSVVANPATRARVTSTVRTVRDAGAMVAEQGRIATTRVLDRGTAGPSPVGHAGAARSTTRGGAGTDEQPSDFTIDEVDLLPDDAYVETILDDNDGRMKQSQIVESTDWSKAKVSRLLSTMDDDGTIVKIQLGRENLICLEGREPEILSGSDRA